MLLQKLCVSSLIILYPLPHNRIASKCEEKSSAVQLFLSPMFQGNDVITTL